tara:strand:+ start:719 stop:1120 length:402 start_codon:yes stop_codon:yes gene_type:complete
LDTKYLLSNTFAKLAPSNIHGIGLFSIRDIPFGQKLFEQILDDDDYIFLKNKDLEVFDVEIQNLIKSLYILEEKGVWVQRTGLNHLDYSYYINHSDEPNLIYIQNKNYYLPKRNIKKGEELTYDYNEVQDSIW